jgi:hypothetical protein
MKKSLLFIALISSIALNAQNFIYPASQHIDAVSNTSSFLELNIYIETDSAEAITYKFTNISNTLPTAWDVGLCDYEHCYIGVPSSGIMTPISIADANNGARGFFKLTLDNLHIPGDGWVKLYVYDENDFDRGDTVSWHVASNGSLSVEEDLKQATFKLWPNPSTDLINISASGAYNGTVYNQIGEQVFTFKGNDITSVSTSDWAKGLYLIAVLNEEGVLSTKKVLVQ